MPWWLDALADPNNAQGGRLNVANVARNFTGAGRQDLATRRGATNAVLQDQTAQANYDKSVVGQMNPTLDTRMLEAFRAGHEIGVKTALGTDHFANVERQGLRGMQGANVARETANEGAMFKLGNERTDANTMFQRFGVKSPDAVAPIQQQQQIDQSATNAGRNYELGMLGNETTVRGQDLTHEIQLGQQGIAQQELQQTATRDAIASKHYKDVNTAAIIKEYQDSFLGIPSPERTQLQNALRTELTNRGMPFKPAPVDPRSAVVSGARQSITQPQGQQQTSQAPTLALSQQPVGPGAMPNPAGPLYSGLKSMAGKRAPDSSNTGYFDNLNNAASRLTGEGTNAQTPKQSTYNERALRAQQELTQLLTMPHPDMAKIRSLQEQIKALGYSTIQ